MAECIGFLLFVAARPRDGRERRQRTDAAHARSASRSIDSRGAGPFNARVRNAATAAPRTLGEHPKPSETAQQTS
jgi:hypothetical protein